jgi:hypothetical protein
MLSRTSKTIDKSQNPTIGYPSPLRLLPELWLMVLEHLSLADIRNLSLINKDMHLLAQPLLFRHVYLTASPSRSCAYPASRRSSHKWIEFSSPTSEQLVFLKIPRISSAVRTCTFLGCYDDVENDFTTEAIFKVIAMFSGLHTLTCEHAEITYKVLQAIRRVHALSTLVLDRCDLSVAVDIPHLRLSRTERMGHGLGGENAWRFVFEAK